MTEPQPSPPVPGAPAGRALEAAGVRSLEDLTRMTRDEVLSLHGMGPKARVNSSVSSRSYWYLSTTQRRAMANTRAGSAIGSFQTWRPSHHPQPDSLHDVFGGLVAIGLGPVRSAIPIHSTSMRLNG